MSCKITTIYSNLNKGLKATMKVLGKSGVDSKALALNLMEAHTPTPIVKAWAAGVRDKTAKADIIYDMRKVELLAELETVDTSKISPKEGLWMTRNGKPNFGNPFVTNPDYIKSAEEFYVGENNEATVAYYNWINDDVLPKGYKGDKKLLETRRSVILANLDKVASASKLQYSGTAIGQQINHVTALLKIMDNKGIKHTNTVSYSRPKVPKGAIDIKSYSKDPTEFKYSALSNFNVGPVTIGANTYATVEGAFQAAKAEFAGDLESAKNIWALKEGWNNKEQTGLDKNYTAGLAAQKLGRQVTMTPEQIAEWDKVSTAKLEEVMREGFKQNPDAKTLLDSTGNTPLFHSLDDGRTAKIWMDIREPDKAPAKPVIKHIKPVKATTLAATTNHSGGASGADSLFEEVGMQVGAKGQNHYYYGKKPPKGNILLTKDEVDEGTDMYLSSVYRTGKNVAKSPAKIALLSRNWFQVKNSSQIIAFAKLTDDFSGVQGGTGYAVAMAQEWNKNNPDNQKELNVFNPYNEKWYKWNGDVFVSSTMPELHENYAGIGSRRIEDFTPTSFINKQGTKVNYDKFHGTFNAKVGQVARAEINKLYNAVGNASTANEQEVSDSNITAQIKAAYKVLPGVDEDVGTDSANAWLDGKEYSAFEALVNKHPNKEAYYTVMDGFPGPHEDLEARILEARILEAYESLLAPIIKDIDPITAHPEIIETDDKGKAAGWIHMPDGGKIEVRRKPVTAKDGVTEIAAKYSRADNIIYIHSDSNVWKGYMENKNWTKPRKQPDGSYVKAIREDAFTTVGELRNFILQHEAAHQVLGARKNGETYGEYETRVNDEAARVLKLALYPKEVETFVEQVVYKDKYEEDTPREDTNRLYIFGDNDNRTGSGPKSGQAVIRTKANEGNIAGIRTKKYPGTKAEDFYTDAEYSDNIKKIDEDIAAIKADGRPIVLPTDGIGTGRAALSEKAPKTYNYLAKKLNELAGKDYMKPVVIAKPKASTKYELFPDVYANKDQENAIDNIQEWYSGSNSLTYLLKGRGGTGKTTIVNKVLEELEVMPHKVMFATPTNKAKVVIKVANKDTNYSASEYHTAAGLLNYREKTVNGQQIFMQETFNVKDPRDKLHNVKVLVVDEVSMLNSRLKAELEEVARDTKTKIIYMGDNVQLAPVNDFVNGVQVKESVVFQEHIDEDVSVLNERMRQGEESPILSVTDSLAASVEAGLEPHIDTTKALEGSPLEVSTKLEKDNVQDFIKAYNKDPKGTRWIWYNKATNPNTVRIVKKIREALFGPEAVTEPFVLNEQVYISEGLKYKALGREFEVYNGMEAEVLSIDKEGVLDTEYGNIKTGKTKVRLPVTFVTLKDNITGKTLPHVPVKNANTEAFIKAMQAEQSTNKSIAGLHYKTLSGMEFAGVINTHKSQGSTYSTVFVDVGNVMSMPIDNDSKGKSLYVATSRPKEKLVLMNMQQQSFKAETPSSLFRDNPQSFDDIVIDGPFDEYWQEDPVYQFEDGYGTIPNNNRPMAGNQAKTDINCN